MRLKIPLIFVGLTFAQWLAGFAVSKLLRLEVEGINLLVTSLVFAMILTPLILIRGRQREDQS